MNRYIITVTYKSIDDNGEPFLCKEKFSVTASSLHYANNKAVIAMRKQALDEFVIEDIKKAS